MPGDLSASAHPGAWVEVSTSARCAILFLAAAGAAGQDPTITVQQATSPNGTNAKALTFTRIDHKAATALSSVSQFTTVAQVAGNTFTATHGALQKLWVIDIDVSTMDGENGFHWLQASVADTGATAQLGGVLYIPHDLRNVPSATVAQDVVDTRATISGGSTFRGTA